MGAALVSIDAKDRTRFTRQLDRASADAIATGAFPRGDQLHRPSASRRYQYQRQHRRTRLAELERAGVIETRRGKRMGPSGEPATGATRTHPAVSCAAFVTA